MPAKIVYQNQFESQKQKTREIEKEKEKNTEKNRRKRPVGRRTTELAQLTAIWSPAQLTFSPSSTSGWRQLGGAPPDTRSTADDSTLPMKAAAPDVYKWCTAAVDKL
jgi:hypothetical protein